MTGARLASDFWARASSRHSLSLIQAGSAVKGGGRSSRPFESSYSRRAIVYRHVVPRYHLCLSNQQTAAISRIKGILIKHLANRKNYTMGRLVILLQVVFFAAYCCWVGHFASEMPFWDDFDIHLRFILSWVESPSLGHRVSLLFNRNVEHFVLTNKLATVFDYYLFKKISFIRLIVYGNFLFLCAIALFLWRKRQYPWLCVWALALLLSPQYPQSFLWATGALQNLSIFLWVLLAFTFAERGSLLSIPFILLATFTQGNGAFVAMAWSTTLLILHRWRLGLIWLLGAFVLLVPVMALPDHPSLALESLRKVPIYMVTMLGAGVGGDPMQSAFVGLLALVVASLGLRPIARRDPVLSAMLIWLVMTVTANAVGRVSFGVDYGFIQSRYRIISLFFVVTIGMAAWEFFQSLQARRMLSIVGVTTFLVVSIYKIPAGYLESLFRRQNLDEATVKFTLFNTGLSYPDPRIPVLRIAEQKGFISIPAPSYGDYIGEMQPLVNRPVTSGRIVQKIEGFLCSQEYLYVEGYSFHEKELGVPTIIFFKNGNAYSVKGAVDVRPDVVAHHHRPDALRSGVRVLIPVASFGSGSGELRLGVEQPDGTVKVAPVGRTYSVPCG